MSQFNQVRDALQVYWQDMETCRSAKAYWALLHVTVCLPDICAALRASNGRTTKARYVAWCHEYLEDQRLTGAERYEIRCRLLHEGKTKSVGAPRYAGFAFGQPTAGQSDHMRLEGDVVHLDVGEMATETKQAVESWVRALEANPNSAESQAVLAKLATLVRVYRTPLPQAGPHVAGAETTILSSTSMTVQTLDLPTRDRGGQALS